MSESNLDSINIKVIQLIAEYFKKDHKDINESTNIETDLGADSLEFAQLVMEFEDLFDIEISDEEAQNIVNVGEIITYIKNKKSEQ